eukprot:357621-Chlamydomonas_euryale.AAC.2
MADQSHPRGGHDLPPEWDRKSSLRLGSETEGAGSLNCSMHGCVHEWVGACMDAWVHAWMHFWLAGWLAAPTNGSVHRLGMLAWWALGMHA